MSGRLVSVEDRSMKAGNPPVTDGKRQWLFFGFFSGDKMKRQSGIILPVYSLPSNYGCGSLGDAAYKFIDWLSAAGQSIWQILPIGPTNYGDSPYQSACSFAGNPYFIDLDLLKKEGLLTQSEIDSFDFGTDPSSADYVKLKENRLNCLRLAFERGKNDPGLDSFMQQEKRWIINYALYEAAKKHFDGKSWLDWPDEELKLRNPVAVAKYTEMFSDDIHFYCFLQYKFFEQWDAVKRYANEKGIKILGDIPVYVPIDSSDVWAEPQFFLLDEKKNPKAVAGVPPDYFNEDGQNWGNPLYDWDKMKSDGYGWWIRRMDGTLRFCDIVRIDHFRGFDSYWSIPFGEKTAKSGHWEKGPGLDFVNVILNWFGRERFIAEDLGLLSDSVVQLLKDSGLAGMKVLQFAFNPKEPSSYLPHFYEHNCICYTGTHDNNTLAGWIEEADKEELLFARKYLGLTKEEGYIWGIIRGGMSSSADLFMAQMQDYLELDSKSRTNIPGTLLGNWKWRLSKDQLSGGLAEKVNEITKRYSR